MTYLTTRRLALSVLIAGSVFTAMVPAQAQPMMGEMGIHHGHERMRAHMTKQIEKHQAELKAKLHLASAQEAAWSAYIQGTQAPGSSAMQSLEREELAKLSTPERLDKMQAVHEANVKAMGVYMKQRNDATRTFYSHLSAEQQKGFDAETLHSPWMMDPANRRR